MRASLPPLQGRYPTSPEEAEATRQAVDVLDRPQDPDWVAQRIFTLLSHYFVADTGAQVHQAIARDWKHELRDYPNWAIDAACKWWLSRHNGKRGKKPMPGDISARAHIEAAMLTAAKQKLQFYEKFGDNPPAFLR